MKKDMQLLAQEALYALDNEQMNRVRSILQMISTGNRNAKGTGAQRPKEDRKPNAYNRFVSAQVVKLKDEEPDLTSSERLKKACTMWKTLSEEEKAKYAKAPSGSGDEGNPPAAKADKNAKKTKGKKAHVTSDEEQVVAEPAPAAKKKGGGRKKKVEEEKIEPAASDEEQAVSTDPSPPVKATKKKGGGRKKKDEEEVINEVAKASQEKASDDDNSDCESDAGFHVQRRKAIMGVEDSCVSEDA